MASMHEYPAPQSQKPALRGPVGGGPVGASYPPGHVVGQAPRVVSLSNYNPCFASVKALWLRFALIPLLLFRRLLCLALCLVLLVFVFAVFVHLASTVIHADWAIILQEDLVINRQFHAI